MNKFSIIKNRWLSQNNKLLFAFWILLKIKKILKINFKDNCDIDKNFKIDIVILTISKDHLILEALLLSLKNICHNINKIYIVSPDNNFIKEFCEKNDLIFINEKSLLGYGKESIKYFSKEKDRSGWIFQQLLKLSGDVFVEMENYIIIDSDTILINKHNFKENKKFIFFENEEWHEPYFRSFRKIFGYKTKNKLSYTSHMMIFNTKKLKLMKKEIESKHKKSWDKIYLSTINNNEPSCISDYDTYANWMLCNFPEEFKSKPLYNKSLKRSDFKNLIDITSGYSKRLKSISFHSYTKD